MVEITAGKAYRFLVIVIYTSAFWFILPSFLYTFPITSQYVTTITTLSNWYFGQAVIYSGLIFFADMLISAVQINVSGSGFNKGFTFGSVLFAAGGIISVVLGLLIFFNQYSFINNLGLNGIIIGALGLGMASGIWHVKSVIFNRKAIISTLNG